MLGWAGSTDTVHPKGWSGGTQKRGGAEAKGEQRPAVRAPAASYVAPQWGQEPFHQPIPQAKAGVTFELLPGTNFPFLSSSHLLSAGCLTCQSVCFAPTAK